MITYFLTLWKKVYDINIKLGRQKGNLSTTKKGRKENKEKINKYDEAIYTIRKYRKRIGIIEEGSKTLQVGKGYYTQTKRNAYKIGDRGEYGNLTIDLPKLFGNLQLVAYKNNKKIYDKRVDLDAIDILTKRYNAKKKHSDLSKRVFNELNTLSEIPIHKTSKKYSKIGSGVVYFNNPQYLLNRLELLGGSISAGNNSVRNEFSEISHVLNKLGVITNNQLSDLLKEYIM